MENQRRSAIAQAAESNKLDPFFEESLIDQYAKAYSLDPDIVWQKSFEDIFVFLNLWKQQDEYYSRYREVEKAMNQNPS